MMSISRLRAPLVALIGLSTVYLAFLVWAYYTGHAGVRRHHLESRWIIHAALMTATLMLLGGARRAGVDDEEAAHSQETRRRAPVTHDVRSATGRDLCVAIAACVALAFLLYGQTLNDGLLSDDFVLAERVRRHAFFVDTGTDFFRPLPLLLWSAIAAWTASPEAWWHVLNITLHGLNGALVFAVALRWGSTPPLAAGAALLFLLFPGHVEAVAWLSGIQDLAMTTGTLLYALSASTPTLTRRSRIASLVWLAAALLSKETAVAAVGLAALTLAQRRDRITRDHWRWWGLTSAVALLFILWRASAVQDAASIVPSLTAFGLKDFVAKPLSALGAPWSAVDLEIAVYIAVLGIWSLLTLAFRAVASSEHPARKAWQVLGLLAWILVAVAPLGRRFFVTPDLLGGRFLYLPAVGWAMMLMVLVDTNVRGTRHAIVAIAPLVLLAGLYGWGTLRHIEPWHRAGIERDRLLIELRTHAARARCDRIAVDRIPGFVQGAYVFLNGLPEAVALARAGRASASKSLAPTSPRIAIFARGRPPSRISSEVSPRIS